MPSTSLRAMSAAAIALSIFAQVPTVASYNAMTYVGCFSSSTPLEDQGEYTWQSSGYCQGVCADADDAAMGMSDGSHCWCGSQLPAKADLVDDDNCSTNCTGYPSDKCGADGYWSVYKTGTDDEVSYYGGGSSSSTGSSSISSSTSTQRSSSSTPGSTTTTGSSSTTNAPVLVTSEAPGKTVVITLSATGGATSTPSSESKNKSGGTNTAGIAAGVVVGVVAIAAIAGAIFFFMRQKKRRAIEEEFSKRSQAQEFGAAGAGATRGVSVRSANDARLDPEAMMHRRLSDGSIADEQDYSRRILKVTNPDDGR